MTGIYTTQEFKRKLFKIYNSVNQEIYGFGVNELRIAFVDDMIIFRTRHNRVRALQVLENDYKDLKQSVDYALFLEFKKRLRRQLQEQTDMHVGSLLRDYDAKRETAITVVCLEEKPQEEGKGK
ncbi:MAG: DUF2294 domain-containing protein [Oscillospiraceae bacterium]|nr:DUF2294 domain-containing protein [Oscillospiraceae bacterium]MDD3260785.1 Na-translocating system protein MpsC family protein [Oscillospiraceae bacterium]